jgi:uncharacterized protein YndB with AHSA1/START domain
MTMERQSIMSTNTVRLHRVLRAPPERIYRAFLDADAMAKWLPPNGFTSGEMQTTVSLKQVSCGTELNVVQEGIPAAIPVEACYLGWQESLTLLAQLVEAETPG